jgi:hypothetical protein
MSTWGNLVDLGAGMLPALSLGTSSTALWMQGTAAPYTIAPQSLIGLPSPSSTLSVSSSPSGHPYLQWYSGANADQYLVYSYNCRPRFGGGGEEEFVTPADGDDGIIMNRPIGGGGGCGDAFDCGATPVLFGTSSVTSYEDPIITIWTYSADHPCPSSYDYYYVKSYNASGFVSLASDRVIVADGLTSNWKQAKGNIIDERQLPTETALSANYPNPFNPTTTINYQLATPGFVTLKLYNVLGEEVARLVDEGKDAGYYTTTWNANANASGIYYLRMNVVDETGKQSYQSVKKIVLMK